MVYYQLVVQIYAAPHGQWFCQFKMHSLDVKHHTEHCHLNIYKLGIEIYIWHRPHAMQTAMQVV